MLVSSFGDQFKQFYSLNSPTFSKFSLPYLPGLICAAITTTEDRDYRLLKHGLMPQSTTPSTVLDEETTLQHGKKKIQKVDFL